ncbi:hypothetical protein [Ferruginibacter sp.]|nr:hypothetical protein [Ferruginibacter sp.]
MKTTLKGITQTVVLMAAVIIFTIYGCKKVDNSAITYDKETIERAKANAANKIAAAGGVQEVFAVNKPMTVAWGDKNGSLVKPSSINSFRGGCTNYDLPVYTNLIQHTRAFQCSGGTGYRIQWEYEVSWNHVIVPINSLGVETIGTFRITDASYNMIIQENVTGIVTDLGVDPINTGNHIYNVKFQYGPVLPTSYINTTGNIVSLSASFASTCPDSYALWIVPASAYGFTANTGLLPCDRHERPIFQQPFVFNGHQIGISGYDPLNSCGSYNTSFIRPDLQEVNYSLDGGISWSVFTIPTAPTSNPIYSSGYIRYNDFINTPVLPIGTYNVVIRYRNWKYNGTPPNPLTIPLLNNACRNIGPFSINSPGELYASYTYEYYPNTVIN